MSTRQGKVKGSKKRGLGPNLSYTVAQTGWALTPTFPMATAGLHSTVCSADPGVTSSTGLRPHNFYGD